MGQNQNRPPRDTSAQVARQRQADTNPNGQDQALRAMEALIQTLSHQGDRYDVDTTPDTVKMLSTAMPGILPTVNVDARYRSEKQLPHIGFGDGDRDINSVLSVDTLDPRYRQLLLQLLGQPR